MGSKQGTTVPLPGDSYGNGSGAKGSRNAARISAAYPETAKALAGDPTTEDGTGASAMRSWYQDNVLDGETQNDLFGTVDMDYGSASAPVGPFGGGAGEAASEHVPNLASPGEAAGVDPKGQPAMGADDVKGLGHKDTNGSTEGIATASKTQGTFNLTKLPTMGDGPK